MPLTVVSQMKKPRNSIYFDPVFRNLIEQHLSVMRFHPETIIDEIPSDQVFRFRGDFFGLLQQKNIDPSVHWIYLRVNNMVSPTDFGNAFNEEYTDSRLFSMIVPPESLIDNLRKRFLTERKMD